jgi:Membrane proteins related to metalloendopeptidases
MVVYDTQAIMQLREQIEATRKDKIEVQQLINDLMATQNDFIERLRELDELIIAYQDEIDDFDEKQQIAINTSIDMSEQLKIAEAEEADQYEKLKEHIRIDYENNRYTYLDALMNAVDFNSVTSELEYIKAIEDYDQKLLADLEEKRRTIANKRAMMDVLNEDIEEIKKNKIEQQEAIELLSEEKVRQIESYQRKINEAKDALATIEELEKQRDEKLVQLEQEYRRKLQLSTATQRNFSGSLLWPMPTSTTITSPFGYRGDPFSGNTSFHRGTDIACDMGSSVIAPAAATVIYVGWMGTGGNCVMLDIGGGMTVIFYHLSAYNCKEGDVVAAGQVVAFSGSTGASTGPHLHYAMKINGDYVDVMQFY